MGRRKKRIGTFRVYILRGISNTEGHLGYYIGYTGCTVEQRISDHFHESVTSRKNTKKLNWLRDMDKQYLTSEILEDNILTEEEALDKEVLYIHYYKICRPATGICKNGDDGGMGGTKNYSEEVIEKLRQSKIGNKWNLGGKRDPESIRKTTEALTNVPKTEAHKLAMSIERKARHKHNRELGIFNIAKERKFSEEQVLEIFRLFNIEYKSPKQIGEVFQCPRATVSTIIYHKHAYPDYKLKHNLKVEPAPFGRGAKYKII